eukprot:2246982-Pyramimonas_sp.AAC.1
MSWVLNIADAENAFCQSNLLERPNGAIYVETCSGLSLPVGSLIELVAPVCGLNGAPLLWRRTLADFLSPLGFVKSLLEPCLWLKRGKLGGLEAPVLIEVDDLLLSGEETAM